MTVSYANGQSLSQLAAANKQGTVPWLWTTALRSLINKDIRRSEPVARHLYRSWQASLFVYYYYIYNTATTQHLDLWEQSIVLPCLCLALFILHCSRSSQCISGKAYQMLSLSKTSSDTHAWRTTDMITETEADGADKDAVNIKAGFLSHGTGFEGCFYKH